MHWLREWHPSHMNAILGQYQGAATSQQGLSLQKSRHEDHPHLQVGTHSGRGQFCECSNVNIMTRQLRKYVIPTELFYKLYLPLLTIQKISS